MAFNNEVNLSLQENNAESDESIDVINDSNPNKPDDFNNNSNNNRSNISTLKNKSNNDNGLQIIIAGNRQNTVNNPNTNDEVSNISSSNNTASNHSLTTQFIQIPKKALDYKDSYCSIPLDSQYLKSPQLSILHALANISLYGYPVLNVSSSVDFNLSPNEPICCIFNECRVCCTPDTCKAEDAIYPIVFLHGHSFNKKLSPETSLTAFTEMQRKLQEEGIINAGEITLSSVSDDIGYGEYGRSGYPVSLRVSYYYINFFDVGRYHITVQKSERIENYAIRLKEILDIVKFRTGANKVNIIAHSMGGLVARQYIALFGENDIDKLIMIGTSNHGISGDVKAFCDFLGANKECDDMSEDSIFLKRLNSNIAGNKMSNVYTIAGAGCDMESGDGDGLIYVEDVKLDNAKNYVIKGSCTGRLGTTLHNDMLDPALYPKVYEIVNNILKK